MKKYLSGILSAAMLISMTPSAISASADGTMNITVESISAEAGDTVYLKLDVTDNPGFSYLRVDLLFDESALTFVDAENGEVSTDAFTPSKKVKALSWDSLGDACDNGTLAVVEFKINDDAAAGDYEVGLKVPGCYNYDEEDVSVNLTAGTVTVKEKYAAVDGITVTPAEKTLKTEGETFTLTPEVTPENATNKKVTFKSSDNSVATVDENGLVTAVANGTATITVTTEDGAKTAECKVTVDIPHVHTMKKIDAKASTCLVQGNNAYYFCEECGKYFKDEEGTAETTPETEKLPLAEHSYTAQNTDPKYLRSEADCTSKAVYYYSCEVCGAIGTEIFEYGDVDKNNHTGNTKKVGQKEATCEEEGYTGDIVCTGCNEIIEKGEVIPANGHTPSDVWSADSESHWKECTVGCGNIIDKSAHSGGEENCHEKAVCEVCGTEYGDLAPDNHDGGTEIRNAVAATEESEGYSGDTYCLGCGEKIADGTVIEKLDHTHSMKKTEAVEATHEEDGNIEYYTCEKCGKIYKDADGAVEINIEDTVVKALGHDYGDGYMSDAENHWKECGCGNVIEKETHEFGEWTEVKAATETEPGSKERVCSVCGYIETADIPVIVVPDDSSNSDNSDGSSAASSSAASTSSAASASSSKAASTTNGGSGTSKPATDNPNTGAAPAALAFGVIAVGAIVAAKKNR